MVVTGIRGQTDVICDPRGDVGRPAEARNWRTFLDDPGLSDSLGSLPTGLYVRPMDAHDLRDAVTTLLSDREQAEELGRNGRGLPLRCSALRTSLSALRRRFWRI